MHGIVFDLSIRFHHFCAQRKEEGLLGVLRLGWKMSVSEDWAGRGGGVCVGVREEEEDYRKGLGRRVTRMGRRGGGISY